MPLFIPETADNGTLIRSKLLLLSLILSGTLFGQQLELFEETESESNTRERSTSEQRTVRDRDGNIITGPQFTLIGTSRIGDNNVLVIKDRMGEIISLNATGSESRSIPGYPGFRVLRVGSGDASINYPDGVDCIEFHEQGVTCDSTRVARIWLTNLDPLESVPDSGRLPDDSPTAENTTNPFEAILQSAVNGNSENDSAPFEPIRIDPEDVPLGMRVVSTPFGDRLVEDSGC